MKQNLSLLLALIMIFQKLPVSSFADDGAADFTAWTEEAAAVVETVTEEGTEDAAGEWSAAESDDIEMLEYHTVVFKDQGISRSRRFVEDGATAGEVPGSMNKKMPVYGWTVPDGEGKVWFDEATEITEDLTITSVPAN